MAARIKTLVIGVTGHRNVDEKSKTLRGAVRTVIEEALADYKPQHVIVLSPLAEGADRIVAREAMMRANARLVVPLPVPAESYEMDFAATVKDFRKLLRQADAVVDAPLPTRSLAWRSYTPQRNKQYAWVGAYVAQHAHVLVAIWDRKPARGVGGTAHVVKWYGRGLAAKTPAACPKAYDTRGVKGLPPAKAFRLAIIEP